MRPKASLTGRRPGRSSYLSWRSRQHLRVEGGSAALLEAVAVVAGFDDLAAVCKPIQQCGCHLGIAEHGAPFAEGQVGGDDERDALVEFADEVEQQRTAVLRERQVAQLIQHDGVLVEQSAGQTAGLTLPLFGIQLIDQIDDAVEPRTLALQDHLTSQSRGQVCFASARATNEHDVACRGEVFPGVQLTDMGFIHKRFAEVKGVQIPRHREASKAQLILVRASLSVSYFRLQQLRQPGGRGELLLAQGGQALLQGARHAAQAQSLELFDQLSLHQRAPVDE